MLPRMARSDPGRRRINNHRLDTTPDANSRLERDSVSTWMEVVGDKGFEPLTSRV